MNARESELEAGNDLNGHEDEIDESRQRLTILNERLEVIQAAERELEREIEGGKANSNSLLEANEMERQSTISQLRLAEAEVKSIGDDIESAKLLLSKGITDGL